MASSSNRSSSSSSFGYDDLLFDWHGGERLCGRCSRAKQIKQEKKKKEAEEKQKLKNNNNNHNNDNNSSSSSSTTNTNTNNNNTSRIPSSDQTETKTNTPSPSHPLSALNAILSAGGGGIGDGLSSMMAGLGAFRLNRQDGLTHCSHCNAPLPPDTNTNNNNNNNNNNNPSIQQYLSALTSLSPGDFDLGQHRFIPFGGFDPSSINNMAELAAAQQNIDIDSLINSLLQNNNYTTKSPTSKKFIDNMTGKKLIKKDCIQIAIRYQRLSKDLIPTVAEFGVNLIDKHVFDNGNNNNNNNNNNNENNNSTENNNNNNNNDTNNTSSTSSSSSSSPSLQSHITAPLLLSSPLTGISPSNLSLFSNKIILMTRGGISFVDKVRMAEQAGALAVIIIQNDKQIWPYTMTDAAKKGTNINIPALMISMKDGELLMEKLLEKKSTNNNNNSDNNKGTGAIASSITDNNNNNNNNDSDVIELITRYREVTCPICQCDIDIDSPIIKLPCSHIFDYDCLIKWLIERSNCPLCRMQLPTDPKIGETERATSAADNAALQRSMFG